MAKILVVDDDKMQCTLVKRILQQEGHIVYTATCGNEGFQIADSKKIDLVFTDIVMPEMDGIELVRKLLSTNKDLPVVVISGDDLGKTYFTNAYELGVKACLEKPVSKRDILELVEQLLFAVKRKTLKFRI